ncbi:MAG: phosphoesterase, partial [Sphingobacteriaceae bacterium]|nr:phosphoesterase [Cytophagaceae bacterium]
MKTLSLLLALSTTLTFAQTRNVTTLQVPGAGQPCRIDPGGVSVLPSGRFVTPAGQTVRITRGAFGLKLSPDGRKAVVLHNGVVTVLDAQNPENALRLPSYDETIPAVVKDASFLGVAIAPDSRTAYLSGGDKGTVVRIDLETGRKTGEIRLDTLGFGDSFTSDLILDAAGTELLVLDRANFRLVRVDLKTERVTASVRVGRIPFGIALSPDGRYAFVANVGQYAYPLVPGVTPQNGDSLMLLFPPYGVPSREAEGGVTVNGRKIPGLGKPNVPEAMSVWTVDLTTNQVVDRFKTGHQVGEFIEGAEIVGGSSPNSIAVGSRYAFVSNATNDLISVIDWKAHRLLADIKLKIHPKLDRYRGLFPFGLTLSRDEKTLYVALLGFNAVAVVDVPTRRVRGLIPTGWGTTRVVLSPDRDGGPEKTLYVTSARGYGAGPNGGRG